MKYLFLPLSMEKKALFTFFLFFSLIICEAQEKYYFELPLKGQEKVNFTIAEVLDARIFQDHCGFVPQENTEQLVPASFAGGLEKGLTEVLPKVFEFGGEKQVCLVVREFHISETNPKSEFGEMQFFLDFYLMRGGQYQHLLHFDDLQVTSGFKIAKSHCANIVKSLQGAGKTLHDYLDKGVRDTEAKWLSKKAVLGVGQDYKMAKASLIRPGIYRSFLEFRANQPSISEIDIVLKKSKSAELLTKKEVSFKNLPDGLSENDLYKQMWGFSDGEHIYINNWAVFQESSFSRLHSIGRFCPFLGKENIGRTNRMVSKDVPKKAYVFDAHRGQAYLLDEAYLDNILKMSSALGHRYKQERDRKNINTKIWYARELNQVLSSTY